LIKILNCKLIYQKPKGGGYKFIQREEKIIINTVLNLRREKDDEKKANLNLVINSMCNISGGCSCTFTFFWWKYIFALGIL
jgi:hypothetical protein